MVGSTVLRTFMYDTNTLDSTFSGSYTAGRLVAVQHTAFTPQGYLAGQGGSNITVPSTMQFVEMYGYTQAGLTSGKRLQVQETLHYYLNGVAQNTPRTLNLDAAYTYDSEGKMTSVNYPETWSWQGQNGPLVSTPGPTYTYSFDAMDRPTGLTDQNNNTVVINVTYNAANQLLTFNTETRSYNNLNQMTRLTITGAFPLDISYNFPAGANDGKISSQKDNLSGETVTYQYDSLNRMISASSSQSWSEMYGFDSFGNLLSKTPAGGAPTLSQSVNPATNQIVGQTYDSNGNQTTGPLGTVYYDAENRIAGVSTAGIQYASDSRNKRIWRGTLSSGNLAQQVYFYGVDGQKLGTYTFSLGQYGEGNTPEMTNSTVLLATFFGSKRIGTLDRLGTAKYNPNGQAQSFYPYGEDRGTVEPNDSLKFATYTRDAATGLDYADQRYYASNFGRFMSADRYRASTGPKDPASWNRYSYVESDPINAYDPFGRFLCDPDLICSEPGDPPDPVCDAIWAEDCGGGGGGGGGGVISPSDFLPVGGSQARIDLGKPDCDKLLNFTSPAAAQAFFDAVQFQFVSLGVMKIEPGDGPGGWVQADVRPAPAQSIPATRENPVNVIQINTNYNWLFFNLNPAHNVATGANTVVNYLAYVNSLGGTNLSSLQLATIIILHELGHLRYPSMDPMIDSAQFFDLIVTDCIQ
jgi:RHS repeat-associated protein